MTRQEAHATPDVVTGTLSIFGDDARVLIDPGATHSFISREYVARVGMTPVPLGCGLEIATCDAPNPAPDGVSSEGVTL